MPLDGSGVATRPPGTTAVAGQTITSAARNSIDDDLYAILNTFRPAFGGGTVNTPALARVALGLEIGVNVQAYSADISDLVTAWTPASASGPASLDFAEDTDNGVHKVTLKAPAALAGSVAVELPSTAGTLALYDADVDALAVTGIAAFSGLLYGLTLSNNGSDATNDIDIAAGIAIDATNAKFMKLAAGVTKRLDAAWAVGTGNGGLDTGVVGNGTYHVWLIMRSDTGVVDPLFSLSASSPTMPTNYDYKRRIGSIVRSGGAIKAFTHYAGNRFAWPVMASDVSTANPGTSAITSTLTVPTGIPVLANIALKVDDVSNDVTTHVLVTAIDQTDTAASATASQLRLVANGDQGGVPASDGTVMDVKTNTSAQIRYRVDVSTNQLTVRIGTMGWIDYTL